MPIETFAVPTSHENRQDPHVPIYARYYTGEGLTLEHFEVRGIQVVEPSRGFTPAGINRLASRSRGVYVAAFEPDEQSLQEPRVENSGFEIDNGVPSRTGRWALEARHITILDISQPDRGHVPFRRIAFTSDGHAFWNSQGAVSTGGRTDEGFFVGAELPYAGLLPSWERLRIGAIQAVLRKPVSPQEQKKNPRVDSPFMGLDLARLMTVPTGYRELSKDHSIKPWDVHLQEAKGHLKSKKQIAVTGLYKHA